MMFFGIILIGIVVYLLLRGNGQAFPNSRQEEIEDPLDILKKRFAQGSITEEEFRRIKHELNS